MKKFLLTFIFSLFFVFFSNTNIKGEELGTCFIKQQDTIHEVSVPFYWYIANEETTTYNMQQSISYYHYEQYINSEQKCLSISGSIPGYEVNGSILNIIKTNFYFSYDSLSSSQYIFDKANTIFKTFPENGDLTITSEYISFDNMPPVLALESLNSIIVVNVEDTLNANYLKQKITAYDEVDGILTVNIHENNYSGNNKTLGTYSIIFSATDNSNNTAYLEIKIKVVDTSKPIIHGNSSLKSYISNPLTIDQIKNTLKITDNYYTIPNSNLNLLEDNFTKNSSIEGDFKISFNVTDPSSNTSETFVVTITSYDDIAPTLTGQSSYKTSNKTRIDPLTIINQLVATDNIDESPIIELTSDSYSDYYYKLGVYQLTYVAKDKNGNTSQPYTINITIEDTTKPVFYISKKFIGVNAKDEITLDQLIKIIEEENNITLTNLVNNTVIKDEYSENKNIPGTYILELNYEYENENINIETYIVIDNYTTVNKETKSTPNKSFWSAIKDFLLKIWMFIQNIFSFEWIKNYFN